LITENLSTLKIHKLTQEQYDRELAAGRIDENALYLTPGNASGSNVNVDANLSTEGAAADAKATGDAINNLAEQIRAAAMDEVYVQDEEPVDAPSGSLWIDTSNSGISPTDGRITAKLYVVDAGTTDMTEVDFSQYSIGDVVAVTIT